MIVKRAKILGYCMGVKKAVDKVLSISEDTEQIKEQNFKTAVFTFGPLIHNPGTIKYLKNRGVKAIDIETFTGTERFENSKVVIRAHGVAPQIKEQLKMGGAEVIDATCPKVVSSQRQAQKYAKDALVILAGDKNHGEIVGLAGYAMMEENATCLLVQNANEAKTVELKGLDEKNGKAVLIAQTTIKKSEYDEIAQILKLRIPGLLVLNTICSATFDRQDALKELAEEVDSILVIGGRNSANTKRLLSTALELKKPAWLIEDVSEIPKEIFAYTSVGLAAGASTPDFVIEEIEKILKNS